MAAGATVSATAAGAVFSSACTTSACACTAGASVCPSASSSISAAPSATESPKFTKMLLTTPAEVLGTSTDALSDSNRTTLSSTAMISPTLTKISATTALSTPISGVVICILISPLCSQLQRVQMALLEEPKLLDGPYLIQM